MAAWQQHGGHVSRLLWPCQGSITTIPSALGQYITGDCKAATEGLTGFEFGEYLSSQSSLEAAANAERVTSGVAGLSPAFMHKKPGVQGPCAQDSPKVMTRQMTTVTTAGGRSLTHAAMVIMS